ncbi:hypothetical protein OGATHE_001302 [Ogataea polymorpha]|uniref:Uncharacterized protein n=1 Tax=Ogataea polymorpha TaxID=460523 RepID=A0A9P8PSI8_9ASCO|nr:hypothetical protein OGATHE_001302 [Ogataea polymorpha]
MDLNSSTGKNLVESKLSRSVSKMYPSGIHGMYLSRDFSVATISEGLEALSRTSKHNLKISENSSHILVLRDLAFAWVICSAEKSKISSDSNLRITMLFSHTLNPARLDCTISGMKLGQLAGQSCLMIWTSVKSLF